MSTSTSLLIILYIKVNRDAALRSSKVLPIQFIDGDPKVLVSGPCLTEYLSSCNNI